LLTQHNLLVKTIKNNNLKTVRQRISNGLTYQVYDSLGKTITSSMRERFFNQQNILKDNNVVLPTASNLKNKPYNLPHMVITSIGGIIIGAVPMVWYGFFYLN
jgi:hypothetical protein